MIPAPISPTQQKFDDFPLASPLRPGAIHSSPVTAFKSRTISMRSLSPEQFGPIPDPFTIEIQKESPPKLKLYSGQGFEFALPEKDDREHHEPKAAPTPARSDPPVQTGSQQTLGARAAAMRFTSPEQSFAEADSIMDVQLPDVGDEEATTSFRRDWKSEPMTIHDLVASHARQESPYGHQRQGSASRQTPQPTPTHERNPTSLRTRCDSAASSLTTGTTNNTIPEDEPTLNISALGLSQFGNTMLVDTSLDQLKSKVEASEPGDGTFGGASFACEGASAVQGRREGLLNVKSMFCFLTGPRPWELTCVACV
jgi:hypothetical protein